MSNLPAHLKYAKTHEWVQLEEDNLARIGITDFAQQELGDLVYVQLPELGLHLNARQQCAVVESVKTASDLYSPVTGEVVAVNVALVDSPEQVNDDAYRAWLFCIKMDSPAELENLMSADAYAQTIED
ncbi:MAG: glycine cleavage system protein H [Methylobacter sp.]|nr:MAG: glycine cleavage system protein H [Methylobacter sp.]PPD05688.1 MAG: glycine cleavage system protein H [Methylobacter sp.]PPD17671.1 MAG: glycine cleavage system protein H [Methylobacter sp.]